MAEVKNEQLKVLELNVDDKVKTYSAGAITVRHYRNFKKLGATLNEATEEEYARLKEVYGKEMSQVELTRLAQSNAEGKVGFEDEVVALLCNVFSVEDLDTFYDGLALSEYASTLEKFINTLSGSVEQTQSEAAKDFLKEKAAR